MIAQAGIPVNLTAVFVSATPANVAISIYDDTGSSPVLLLSPVQMTNVRGNTYRGKFTPSAGKLYVAFMAVYTDASFTSLDSAFAAVEQAVGVQSVGLIPSVQSVVGLVDAVDANQTTSTFSIFLGDEKTIYLKAINASCCDYGPLDLSSCTEIKISMPKADGTFIDLLYSLGQVVITPSELLGKFSAIISSVNSALLNVGEYQDLFVTFTIAGEIVSVRFQSALSVFER